MDQLFTYLTSPEFNAFLQGQAKVLVLVAMLLVFAALLLELRLPVRSYWDLPAYAISRFLSKLGLKKAPPVWGICTSQTSDKPLSLVAIELIDATTQKVLRTTYSNNKGQYGFPLKPGRYLIKATKSQYHQPSFLNPENIEIKSFQHAFVTEVTVVNQNIAPLVDLALLQADQAATSNTKAALGRYGRMAIFQTGHLLIIICAIISIVALWLAWDAFYALILGLCLLLLFIKLYLLQMIGVLASDKAVVAGENHA